MEFIAEEGKQLYKECSTLILPALSIGNVGQLAVDLLIASSKAERIGYFDNPNVVPCVGNDAYTPAPQGDLALPLEAYESPSSALTFIQQRSPVVKGMMIEFAKTLADFAVASGKKHIIILSSLDFGRWQTIDMSREFEIYQFFSVPLNVHSRGGKAKYANRVGWVTGSKRIYYLSDTRADGADDNCEKLGWKRMKEYDPNQKLWKYLNTLAEGNVSQDDISQFEDDLGTEDYYPSLPFAAMFSCFKAKGLKVTCLLCYCSEGDNIPDAFHLAEAACNLEGINPETFKGNEGGRWVIPFSWQSVYGPPPDMSLF